MLKSLITTGRQLSPGIIQSIGKNMPIISKSHLTKFAVLWDLDGTLCDSAELHYQSWVAAFAEHGFTYDRETFERGFGMNNTGVIREFLEEPAPELIAQISGRKEIIYRQTMPGHLHALPGAQDWLARLHNQNIPMAIASSAPMEDILLQLKELDFRPFFDVIISVAGRPGKPNPLVFLEAAQSLNVLPECCIVVEDAIAGVEAARRAMMKCIAVTMTHPTGALQTADIIVDRLDHLPEDIFLRLSSNFSHNS